MSKRGYALYSLVVIALIYLAAILIQSRYLTNCDASWFLYGARKVLMEGGSYINNFVETNPPLILYLSYPPAFVSWNFHVSQEIVFRTWIFFLSGVSLFACFYFIKKIFSQNLSNGFVIFVIAAFCMLILPFSAFGQREHLLVIFTLPWFFYMALRLESYPVQPKMAFFTGLFAGIGFLIKPFFIMAFILVEAYFILKKKKLLAFMRIDILAMILVLTGYLLVLGIYHYDYVTVIVPLLSSAYFHLFDYKWYEILLTPGILLYCAALCMYFLQNKNSPYRSLTAILFLAATGFLISYLVQRTPFYYHFYPIFLFVLLAIALEFSSFYYRASSVRWDLMGCVLLASFSFVFVFDYVQGVYGYGNYYSDNFKKMITFMKKNVAHKKVYFLTTNGDFVFPMVTDAGVNYFSKLYGLICMFDIRKQAKQISGQVLSNEEIKNELFFLNIILSEIKTGKPDFIFVDTRDDKTFFRIDQHLDFIKYFSQYSEFRKEWKHYHYFSTVESSDFYRYAVYKRD